MHIPVITLTAINLAAILLTSSFCVQATMYKWVDDEGQMHFGDKIPPKYLVKEHDELNEQGVTTRHSDAVKTPKTAEEKAEQQRLVKEKKQAELVEKKKKQRDRVLLDTYTTERDLVVARDSRLEAVGSQIQLAETIIQDSNKKIESMEKQVAQIEASNREVPAYLNEQIDIEKQQVVVQTKVMEGHKKRSDEISEQFNGYLERFKVLKAEQAAKRARIQKERGF